MRENAMDSVKRRTDLKHRAFRTRMEGFMVLVFTGRGEKQGDRAQSFFMSHFIFWFLSTGMGEVISSVLATLPAVKSIS